MKNIIYFIILLLFFTSCSANWQQQLQFAIEQGDLEQVKILLEEDIDLDITFPNGKTPLSMAVEREALHIVKLLLAHGADVNLPNEDGTVPLHVVTHPSVAGLLLEQGTSLNVTDQDGNTPLHLAKNAAVAKFLLEKGADVKATNKYSFTPIEMAVADGRVDVFEEIADNWVRLTNRNLEKLRRLGKNQVKMAARLSEYQLPQSPVVTNTKTPAGSKVANAEKVKKLPDQPQVSVRFDGLYQADDSDSRYFIRFYSDMTVATVSSTKEAKASNFYDQVNNIWSVGKYVVKGNRINFSSTSSYGTVEYYGTIYSEEKINLNSKSLINGNKGNRTYYFVKCKTNSTSKPSAQVGARPPKPKTQVPNAQLCVWCYGTGMVNCSLCGGAGGEMNTYSRYNNNTQSYDYERIWENCIAGCRQGKVICTHCKN